MRGAGAELLTLGLALITGLVCSCDAEVPTPLSGGWMLYREAPKDRPGGGQHTRVLSLVCSEDAAFLLFYEGASVWTGRGWSQLEEQELCNTSRGAWASKSGVLYVPCEPEIRWRARVDESTLPVVESQKSEVVRWDGRRWELLEVEGQAGFRGPIFGVDEREVYLLGEGGRVAVLEGDRFKAYSSGTWRGLSALWGASGSDLLFAGEAGVIYHHDGARLTRQESGTTSDIAGLFGTSSKSVWAWTHRPDEVLRWDGRRWAKVGGLPGNVAAVAGGPERIYAAGSFGLAYLDKGGRWVQEVPLERSRLVGLCATSAHFVAATHEGEALVRPRER